MRGSQWEEMPSHRGACADPGQMGAQVSSTSPVLAGTVREECWSHFSLWGASNHVLAEAFITIINDSSNR